MGLGLVLGAFGSRVGLGWWLGRSRWLAALDVGFVVVLVEVF